MRRVILMMLLAIVSTVASSDDGCAQNDLGIVFCAPPGGTAVSTLVGVACAKGRCAADNLGYLKCSNELGGGATKDNLGRVVCVGGCVSPSKKYCVTPK